MPKPVYLDYHATTPVDPRVLEAMLPYFTEEFGNPASRQHAFGWHADEAVGRARGEVASLIGATAGEIVFTSGATESNNLAIKGAASACRERGNHVVTVATEHKSVLDSFKRLERDGLARHAGSASTATASSASTSCVTAVTDKTVLVSVMAANNEIGVLQPLAEIGAITGAAGALLHTDAAQAAGKVALDVNAMGIDLLSLTGHKYYGPKGAGALYIRRKKPRIQLACQIDGGGHEQGLRSGTLNVPGIVGLGRAAAICRSEMAAESTRFAALRDRLLEGLRQATRRRARQWFARASAAAQSARQFRQDRRRIAADGARRPCGVDRLRVQLRQSGAVARPPVHRRRRRAGRRVDQVRPRPVHDRRRHRFRDRAGHDRRQEPAARDGGEVIFVGSGLKAQGSSKIFECAFEGFA